jgi:hypothetical protein
MAAGEHYSRCRGRWRTDTMTYGSTLLATNFGPDCWQVRLRRALLFFIPRANPDYERLYRHVRKWYLELDDSGCRCERLALIRMGGLYSERRTIGILDFGLIARSHLKRTSSRLFRLMGLRDYGMKQNAPDQRPGAGRGTARSVCIRTSAAPRRSGRAFDGQSVHLIRQ